MRTQPRDEFAVRPRTMPTNASTAGVVRSVGPRQRDRRTRGRPGAAGTRRPCAGEAARATSARCTIPTPAATVAIASAVSAGGAKRGAIGAGHADAEHVVRRDDDAPRRRGRRVSSSSAAVRCESVAQHDDGHLVVERDDVESVLLDRQPHERGVELAVEEGRALVGDREGHELEGRARHPFLPGVDPLAGRRAGDRAEDERSVEARRRGAGDGRRRLRRGRLRAGFAAGFAVAAAGCCAGRRLPAASRPRPPAREPPPFAIPLSVARALSFAHDRYPRHGLRRARRPAARLHLRDGERAVDAAAGSGSASASPTRRPPTRRSRWPTTRASTTSSSRSAR